MDSGIATVSSTERTTTLLESERRARGLSREELASLAGLSPRTIYALELEGVRAHRATRRVLAIALGCDPDNLFSPHNGDGPGEKSRAARNTTNPTPNGGSTCPP
jgi:transcriptional regulator with XRE-family HTH domain